MAGKESCKARMYSRLLKLLLKETKNIGKTAATTTTKVTAITTES